MDVEDYYHVEAFTDIVPCSAWDSYPSRVEANTVRLYELETGRLVRDFTGN